MAQIHWDSLIQIRPNTMGELAKVTPFGRLSLTQTILEKFPDRKATVFCHRMENPFIWRQSSLTRSHFPKKHAIQR